MTIYTLNDSMTVEKNLAEIFEYKMHLAVEAGDYKQAAIYAEIIENLEEG